MIKTRFLIAFIVAAAISMLSSHANAGGYYYGGYGGGYYGGYASPYYDDGYYAAGYGYGPGWGAYHYGLAGLLLPFLWGDSWGPPDDYCHRRIRIYDNWGGWVWGQRIVC
ncbi:MAG TPA: hypothetical protein VFB31_13830 [Pseudolabrys sp.]|nr:hypothetical protein [Pseudolabrys sp.]